MRGFWILTRLRLRGTLRTPTSAAFVFLLPLVLLLVVGFIFANGHPFERPSVIVVALAPADGLRADAITQSVSQSSAEVRIARASNIESAMAKVRTREVNAVIVATSPPQVHAGNRDLIFAQGLLATLDSRAGTVTPVVTSRWTYVHYLFPGMLTFTVLVSGLFGLGYSMARYRQNLFLKKLATTPVSRATFVASQLAARTVLVLLQVVLMLVVGHLVFELPMSARASLWLVTLSTLGLLTFSGMGFAIACFVKSESLLADAINAFTGPLVLFSEIFFPLIDLPKPLVFIGSALPSTQMVRLARSILFDADVSTIALAQGTGILALWAALFYLVALKLFRWHR